jgi:hypothetical protein
MVLFGVIRAITWKGVCESEYALFQNLTLTLVCLKKTLSLSEVPFILISCAN